MTDSVRRPAVLSLLLAAAFSAATLDAQMPRGYGTFYALDNSLKWKSFKTHSWSVTWDKIIPGKWTNSVYSGLLFYDRITGSAAFYDTDGKGGIKRLSSYTFSKYWDQIVPGRFGGSTTHTDLLFYDRKNRIVSMYKSDGTGKIVFMRNLPAQKDWDLIVAGNFSNSSTSRDDLLFYSRKRGEITIYRTDGYGRLIAMKSGGARRTWDIIVPGQHNKDGYTELMFYERPTGTANIVRFDGAAKMIHMQSNNIGRWWDRIVPLIRYRSNFYHGILCYNQRGGYTRAGQTDGTGRISLHPQQSVGKTAFRIVPGAFDAKWSTDVLFYKAELRLRIQAVRLTGPNGVKMAAITADQVTQWVDEANKVFGYAGVRFDYDPALNFETVSTLYLYRRDGACKGLTPLQCQIANNEADAIVKRCKGRIVVFFRYGNGAGPTGSAYSGNDAAYVMMPGFNNTRTRQHFQNPGTPGHGTRRQNIQLFAHEVGHYLGLGHTHAGVDYSGYTDPHKAVVDYLKKKKTSSQWATLDMLDGEDWQRSLDTPPDAQITYFDLKGWNPADISRDIVISSIADKIALRFNPLRHNVMSYFGIIDNHSRVTDDQVRRIREWLHQSFRIALLTHRHGSAATWGTACRGKNGLEPIYRVSGCPDVGQQIRFELVAAPKSQAALHAIGLSRSQWNGLSLPFEMTPLGAPGCTIYCDHLIATPRTTSADGKTTVKMTIPTDKSLIGKWFYSQYVISSSANAFGLITTKAATVWIGG